MKLITKIIFISVLIIGFGFLPHSLLAQTSGYQFSTDLTIGSTGQDVMMLQIYLNSSGYTVASSGPGSPGQESTYFGSLTQAALANFQADHNIQPAAGYFGPITRTYINTHPLSGGGNSGGGNVSGCLPGYLYNAVTGEPCDASGGTSSGNSQSGDGQLHNIRSSGGTTDTLTEGDTNVKVFGFKTEVQDGDVTLDKLEVEFTVNGSSGASNDISDYINSVSIRLGSHELDSQDASDGDQNGDTTSFSFRNLDGLMGEDSTAIVYVLVDAVDSIGGDEEAANIEVSIPDDGIGVITGDDFRDTYSYSGTKEFSYSGSGAPDAPTASLTLNNHTSAENPITAHVGDTNTWTWSSTGGETASSTYSCAETTGGASCGSGVWLTGNTLQGSVGGTVVQDSANRTYTVTYTVINSDGVSDSDSIVEKVLPSTVAAPTATLTANGQSSITLNTGATYNYHWSSTNADQGSSNYTSTCGYSSTNWVIRTTSGDGVDGTGGIACVYTINFVATQSSTGRSATATITVTVNSGGGGEGCTGLDPCSGPVGTTVTMTGSGFGATRDSQGGVLINQCSGNGGGCTTLRWIYNPTSWSDTRIVFRIPTGLSPGAYRIKMCNRVNGTATCSQGLDFTLTSGTGYNYSNPNTANALDALNNFFNSQGAVNQTATVNNAINPPAENTCLSINFNLHLGSTDSETSGQVSLLQNYLIARGYLVMPAGVSTGYFGQLTLRAVSAFQVANRIDPSVGFVGPISRAKIVELSCLTSSSVPPPSSTPPSSNPPPNPTDNSPWINSLSPSVGPTGTTVTVHGLGFTSTGNKINFSGVSNFNLDNLSSSDNGTALVFTIPDGDDYQCLHSHPSCSIAQRLTQPGEHAASITNAKGTSNSNGFTVIAPCSRSDNCGAQPAY